jgi:hypothetical protein
MSKVEALNQYHALKHTIKAEQLKIAEKYKPRLIILDTLIVDAKKQKLHFVQAIKEREDLKIKIFSKQEELYQKYKPKLEAAHNRIVEAKKEGIGKKIKQFMKR